MGDCSCPRIDGYRIRSISCPVHGADDLLVKQQRDLERPPYRGCPTRDCPGDTRYAAPGRHHLPGCEYPRNVL